MCNTVGVPIKEDNTVHAQTTMTFLGIELDTIAIDNVLKIKNSLSEIRVRRKVTLRELQSLIGLLSFACCVDQSGTYSMNHKTTHFKKSPRSPETQLHPCINATFCRNPNLLQQNSFAIEMLNKKATKLLFLTDFLCSA
jgi:hypothetical protein